MRKIKDINYYLDENGDVYNSKGLKLAKTYSSGGVRVRVDSPNGKRTSFAIWKIIAEVYFNFDFTDKTKAVHILDGDILNTKVSNYAIVNKEEFGVPIQGFENYRVNENGEVFSFVYGRVNKLTPHLDGSKRYFQVHLGKHNNRLIHRLVAQVYIPNPENKQEVDHIDANTHNNHVSNLRWATRTENLHYSFEYSSPVKYYKECYLVSEDNLFKMEFKSIISASKYAEEQFGCSKTMISKHYKHNGYKIIKKP